MPPRPLPPAEPMRLAPLAEIARGGMGSVELVRVMDGRLAGEVVAIKRLHPSIAQDPQFVSMFLDEAWMTAALDHPNVMRVAAWGNDERGMFLACELVQGVSLARLLKEAKQNQEPFAERTCAYIASQICGGLTAAHGLRGTDGQLLGLVHRDLTPGNVLVSFDGLVKIVDFGIAKAEERITHTRTGMLKGKPAYMAPEQARGGKVDLRADIFSFGVLLYELLAGRKPWTAKGAFDVMMEIASQPPPDLGSLRKGLNPEFVAIVHKCLEKKPDQRFSSTAEIQAAFDAWRNKKGFAIDDQVSLANFVKRNSAPQIKWFDDALKGDIERAAAPTFKELEEQIDAAREGNKRKTGAPAMPAAGRPATPAPAAGAPAAPAPSPTAGPISGRPAPPVAGRPPPPSMGRPPPPSAARPPPSQKAAAEALPLPPPSTRPATAPKPIAEPAIAPTPIAAERVSAPQPVSARSPFAPLPVADAAPAPQPAASRESSGQWQAAQMQPSAAPVRSLTPAPGSLHAAGSPAARPASTPPPPSSGSAPQHGAGQPAGGRRLASGGTEYMGDSSFADAVRATLPKLNELAAAAAAKGPPSASSPSAASPAAASPAKGSPSIAEKPAASQPKPRRSRAGLVAVLIAIPLLGAGVFGWIMRDRLRVLLGGPPRTQQVPESVSPPEPPPPGKPAPSAPPTTP